MATRVVLQSWKEISAHVGRTDRTLQRWERKFGFPVHRPSGKSRSAVIAVVSEIEEWMRDTPLLMQAQLTAKPNLAAPLRNTGMGLGVEDKRARPELISICAPEPSSGSGGGDAALTLEGNLLRLVAGIEEQRQLRREQRNLLRQHRNLRRQHKDAKSEVIRQLNNLAAVLNLAGEQVR